MHGLAGRMQQEGCGSCHQVVFLLNTFVTVTLYDSEDQTILDGCMTLCSDYEKLLSKTLEGSEIYKLNHRRPGERTITVSEKTAQVLAEGLEYCRMSRGPLI